MKATDPIVRSYLKKRNDLVIERCNTESGTHAHKELTTRIENLGSISEIITKIHTKELR